MRRFQVVCRIGIRLRNTAASRGGRSKDCALYKLGQSAFGLTDHQVRLVYSRADADLRHLAELAHRRVANPPPPSAREEWSYL